MYVYILGYEMTNQLDVMFGRVCKWGIANIYDHFNGYRKSEWVDENGYFISIRKLSHLDGKEGRMHFSETHEKKKNVWNLEK